MNTKVTRNLSYGLFILTAREGSRDNGCVINTVTQVGSKPVRISISVNKENYTCGMIERTKRFNISILTENAAFDTFRHFGFQSGRDVDKFEGADASGTVAGIRFARSENGISYLTEQTNAYLSCDVYDMIDTGSHMLFLADLVGGEILSNDPSVTYAYYFANIKPKPAPKPEEKKGWVCTICGYIYEGEDLPADFICPICKHPASDFVRL